MIKILHAADLHLDAAFSSLSAEKASRRRMEQRSAVKLLKEACQDCDLLLLPGDLFDSARIYQDTLDALKELFSSISARVFIAPGNHDYLAPGSPYLTENWGENVHIFTSSSIEKVHLEGLNCDIYGAAFTAPEMPALLKAFRVEDESAINIMLLHGDFQPGSAYAPLSLEEIARSGLDYLALGHVHAMAVEKAGATTWAYPGCYMGRGFDELGEKGVLRGSVSKGEAKMEFLPLAPWKYEILTVEAGDEPLAAIRAALPGDTKKDCYRILLTGEADSPDTASLEEALEGEFFSLSIRDRTSPRKELWACAGADSLRGHFLQNLKQQLEAAGEEEQRKILLAAKLVSALMDGREVPL